MLECVPGLIKYRARCHHSLIQRCKLGVNDAETDGVSCLSVKAKWPTARVAVVIKNFFDQIMKMTVRLVVPLFRLCDGDVTACFRPLHLRYDLCPRNLSFAWHQYGLFTPLPEKCVSLHTQVIVL